MKEERRGAGTLTLPDPPSGWPPRSRSSPRSPHWPPFQSGWSGRSPRARALSSWSSSPGTRPRRVASTGVPRGESELVIAAVVLAAVVVLAVVWRTGGAALIAVVLLALGGVAARIAFAARVVRPAARPSTGGDLEPAFRRRQGRRPTSAPGRGPWDRAVELRPGDDLVQLVEDAVARVPTLWLRQAATARRPWWRRWPPRRSAVRLHPGRNPQPLRPSTWAWTATTWSGALGALVDGGERVVDLAEVNGRVFVNNASLGVYAEAVQRDNLRRQDLDVAEHRARRFGRTDPITDPGTGPDGRPAHRSRPAGVQQPLPARHHRRLGDTTRHGRRHPRRRGAWARSSGGPPLSSWSTRTDPFRSASTEKPW